MISAHPLSHTRSAAAVVALAAALLPLPGWAVDVDPGDYVPAPPGTTVGLLYVQHAERDQLYAGGVRAGVNPRLTSDVGILRLVHYTTLGGLTVAPQVLMPFGRLDAGGDTAALGRTSGVGDVILAAPVWVINDAASRTHLGITPYLFLPTGSYDHNRPLNLGENRWKLNLQVGLAQGLTERWHVDLTADATFYGKNDAFGAGGKTLRQEQQYQGQAYLRYQFSAGTNTFVGLSQTTGGATRVDGTANDLATRQRKISVGASHFIAPTTQLMVSLGRDLRVDNGLRENARINLRMLQVF